MNQGVSPTFKFCCLGSTLCEATAAIESGSSDSLWKGVITLKNIPDSWEEVKESTLTGVWKKLIPTFMGDFEGFKTSREKITVDVVEIARELKVELKM